MTRLQEEGIRGSDLVFACIGPALEVFTRFSRVETAEGHEIPLSDYLEKVWEVVGRLALEQVLGGVAEPTSEGTAPALEEDARLTALFLWTLQSSLVTQVKQEDEEATSGTVGDEGTAEEDQGPRKRGFALSFDLVRRFAQPLGIHLDAWEGSIIEVQKGIVRLLPLSERSAYLFGREGQEAFVSGAKHIARGPVQRKLLPGLQDGREKRTPKPTEKETSKSPLAQSLTTLDRIHIAMLLQAGGQTSALRSLLQAELNKGPVFMRLANALSALYPRESEEKRLIDAVLLAIPGR